MKARLKTLNVNGEIIKIRTSISRASGTMNFWNVTINGRKWVLAGNKDALTGKTIPFENFEDRREAAEMAAYAEWVKLFATTKDEY